MNTNNSNIGHSSNIPEFKWYAPNGQDHINGVKFSAPAFDVPPTPASSYSNLHVILEPHSHEITSSSSTPMVLPSTFNTRIVQSSMIDSTPVMVSSMPEFKAIPSVIDPEQPGARSEEALTSLKSEVAPMVVPMVPLDEVEYEPLEERTDRPLPESVDLELVDLETEPLLEKDFDDYSTFDFTRKRNYDLDKLEDAERLWRSSLTVSPTVAFQWKLVGAEVLNFPGYGSWSIWLSGLKNSLVNKSSDLIDSAKDVGSEVMDTSSSLLNAAEEYLVNKSNDLIDSAKEVVSDIKETAHDLKDMATEMLAEAPKPYFYYNYSLPLDMARMKLYAYLDQLESEERMYRIGRAVDAIWSGHIHKVGLELMSTFGTLGSISAWFNNLKSKLVKPVEFKADAVAPAYLGLDQGLDIYSFSRGSTAYLTALEEEERAYRVSKGIDAVLAGKWHQIGLDLTQNYFGSHSWFAWLRNLERSLEVSAMDTIESLKTKPAYIAPRDVGSDFFQPEPIDFTFRSNRTPFDIIALEEQERAFRIEQGANPVLYGLWYRIGLELKHKYSLRPTFASTASTLVRVASDVAIDLAGKAESVIESISEKGHELYDSAVDRYVDAVDFAEKDSLPLNYFAYTAEPVDFTFKHGRCPAYIFALEEEERAYRISHGTDAVLYGKWNAILSAPIAKPISLPAVSSLVRVASDVVEQAKETLVEKTSELSEMASEIIYEAEPTLGSWTGYMGSLAHSLVDRTHHLVDVAKESLGYVDPSSIAGITKAEETERLRRMNEKVDPMLSARLGRVNDELLRSVKSV